MYGFRDPLDGFTSIHTQGLLGRSPYKRVPNYYEQGTLYEQGHHTVRYLTLPRLQFCHSGTNLPDGVRGFYHGTSFYRYSFPIRTTHHYHNLSFLHLLPGVPPTRTLYQDYGPGTYLSRWTDEFHSSKFQENHLLWWRTRFLFYTREKTLPRVHQHFPPHQTYYSLYDHLLWTPRTLYY